MNGSAQQELVRSEHIQSLNDSPCYSNQQQPSPATFIRSACISSTMSFSNLTHTEFCTFFFDKSELSDFIEPFPCYSSPQHIQTKYSTLNDAGKMNHANKQEYLSYLISLFTNKHKLDDCFLIIKVSDNVTRVNDST